MQDCVGREMSGVPPCNIYLKLTPQVQLSHCGRPSPTPHKRLRMSQRIMETVDRVIEGFVFRCGEPSISQSQIFSPGNISHGGVQDAVCFVLSHAVMD